MRTRRQLLAGLAAVLATPLAALSEKPARVWRIGVLATRRRPETPEDREVWDRGHGNLSPRLKELGYEEGTNLEISWRFGGGDYARLPALATELVGLPVDLIVTDGSPGIRAAQGATKTIPIVFFGGTDLVASGFVKSLARPGGNTTGVSLLLTDSVGKQVELVSRMVPTLRRLAVLTNSGNPSHPALLKFFREAAAASGLEFLHLEAKAPKEIDEAFARASREHAEALIWTTDAFFLQQQLQIVALAARYRLPVMTGALEYASHGGLMSYGPNRADLVRRVADYVDKILKGANPGDLPVEQPKKLELVINRTTAKSLGLEIPPDLLVLADKVIE